MTRLAQVPAQPRPRLRRAGYPTMAAAALVLGACTGGMSQEAASPQTASVSAPVRVLVTASPAPRDHSPASEQDETDTGDDLLAGAPASFPEDTAEPPMVGCGGGCPPAYVLETQAKDEMQIEARVKYCAKAGRDQWSGPPRALRVTAEIDLAGQAQRVRVESDAAVPAPIRACIEHLVASAPFGRDPPFKRTTNAQVALQENGEP